MPSSSALRVPATGPAPAAADVETLIPNSSLLIPPPNSQDPAQKKPKPNSGEHCRQDQPDVAAQPFPGAAHAQATHHHDPQLSERGADDQRRCRDHCDPRSPTFGGGREQRRRHRAEEQPPPWVEDDGERAPEGRREPSPPVHHLAGRAPGANPVDGEPEEHETTCHLEDSKSQAVWRRHRQPQGQGQHEDTEGDMDSAKARSPLESPPRTDSANSTACTGPGAAAIAIPTPRATRTGEVAPAITIDLVSPLSFFA